jgi:hypothetical protein
MKTCANCDTENPDDAPACHACSTATFVSASPDVYGGHIITPEEHHFWQLMSFRQFAVFFIRLQAIWFFFNAVFSATGLIPILDKLRDIFSGYPGYAGMRHTVLVEILRVVLNVAAGIICIQFADRIISWLVKDLIPRPAPNASPKTTLDQSGNSAPQTET